MLEQAKACLNSGARESLRCAKGAPSRSKRSLHSTFWNHGAGDIGPPPWAIPVPPPRGLPLSHDDTPVRSTTRPNKEATSWNTRTEGVFLDFLYPPQALAYVSRAGGQQCERWERRNARRLPEGFIHASRGYASRSYAHAASARSKRPFGDEDKSDAGPLDNAAWKAEEVLSEIEFDSTGRHTNRPRNVSDMREPQSSQEPDDLLDPVGFADLPADLAQVNSGPGIMHQLRSMPSGSSTKRLRTQTGKFQSIFDEAWTIYESLSTQDKNDVRLKKELLDWLATIDDEQARVRGAELYNTIPVEQRTARVYQSALSMYLQRNLTVQAIKLHKEALMKIDNAEQITTSFFEYAVTQSRWQLAMYIEAHYRAALVKKTGSERAHMFWYRVGQIPRLLPRALLLARYLRSVHRARTGNDQVRRFCVNFFRSAFAQEFQVSESGQRERSFRDRGIPKISIRALLRSIQNFGGRDPKYFEDMIMAMIRPDARYDYTDTHEIVSYMYLSLRETGHQVSERLFRALLQRLTKYYENLQKHEKLSNSVSVNTLALDWKRMYPKMRMDAVARLLSFFARLGDSRHFTQWLEYVKTTYPRYDEQVDVLWTSIYLHARRAELPEAKSAFETIKRLAQENGQAPTLKCWNVLLHAQYRADDLQGALNTLQALIDAGLTPDEYSFHPVMGMLAIRGDVGGVEDLISQYDRITEKKREVAFLACLLTAHVTCGEIEKAESLLRTTIVQVRNGEVRGSLTGSFNILLTEHALRRNVAATMRTYRWMKDEGIRTDPDTYAALISALTIYRRTDAAYRILRTVMREQNVMPTAFHYALVMTGYIKERSYDKALDVHNYMQSLNVRQTVSSSAAYLKVKALQAHRESLREGNQQLKPQALNEVMVDLNNFLLHSQGADISAKQPQIALENPSQARDRYFAFLIELHGKRNCLEAARKLFDDAQKGQGSGTAGTVQSSLGLLASFMSALTRARQWRDVEDFWLLAKEQADSSSAPVPVTQLQTKNATAGQEVEDGEDLQLPISTDAQEAGFQVQSPESVKSTEDASSPLIRQDLLEDRRSAPTPLRPSPGRNHILTRPLRSYIFALAAQSRISDLLTVVSQLYAQGYVMNNLTWNIFIQKLCQSTPPLTLLAFSLTERFLIPQFPGWAPIAHRGYIPNRAARAEGLEYIRARYLRPDQLMPQYETLVRLGAALLTLRRIAATGRSNFAKQENMKDLTKYVGTMAQVRKQAPRTLFAVQSMPNVDDALQRNLLRR